MAGDAPCSVANHLDLRKVRNSLCRRKILANDVLGTSEYNPHAT